MFLNASSRVRAQVAQPGSEGQTADQTSVLLLLELDRKEVGLHATLRDRGSDPAGQTYHQRYRHPR
jgi:hypothetical protein